MLTQITGFNYYYRHSQNWLPKTHSYRATTNNTIPQWPNTLLHLHPRRPFEERASLLMNRDSFCRKGRGNEIHCIMQSTKIEHGKKQIIWTTLWRKWNGKRNKNKKLADIERVEIIDQFVSGRNHSLPPKRRLIPHFFLRDRNSTEIYSSAF